MECDEMKVDNLKYLVKKLTTTGKDELDEALFKKLKAICKTSDLYVKKLYEFLFKQFSKKHAEVRFSCFQICDQIFRKSHHFRCLVLEDFCALVDLVLGKGSKIELKPIEVAKKLKKKAIVAFKEWHGKFGKSHHKLVLGIEYLMQVKNVDFDQMTAMTQQERDREEERRRVSEEVKAKRVEKVEKTLAENVPQIKNDLIAFRNCFKLLIPDVNDFFIPVTEDETIVTDVASSNTDANYCNSPPPNPPSSPVSDSTLTSAGGSELATSYGSDFTRSAGILKGTTIKIDLAAIKRVQETPDNQTVVENLKELINTLSTVWLAKIKYFQQSIMPYSEGNSGIIKELVGLKNSVQSAVEAFTSVTIIPMNKIATKSLKISNNKSCNISNDDNDDADEDDDDDDDFIEVTETDPRVSSALHSEAELLGILSNSASSKLSSWIPDLGAGPSGCSDNNSSFTKEKSLTAKTAGLTPESFGGDWKPPSLHVNPLAGVNQVWVSSGTHGDADDCSGRWSGMLGIATTPVELPSSVAPVRWQCRASLPSGRLCPRRDRFRCPLHGLVVPRCSTSGQADLPFTMALLQLARRRERERCQSSDASAPEPSLTDSLSSEVSVKESTCEEYKYNSPLIEEVDARVGEIGAAFSNNEESEISATERVGRGGCISGTSEVERTEQRLGAGTPFNAVDETHNTVGGDEKRSKGNQTVDDSPMRNFFPEKNDYNKYEEALNHTSNLDERRSAPFEAQENGEANPFGTCSRSIDTEELRDECGNVEITSTSSKDRKSYSSRKKLCSALNQMSSDILDPAKRHNTPANGTDVLDNSMSILKSLSHKEPQSRHPSGKDCSGASCNCSNDTSTLLGNSAENLIDSDMTVFSKQSYFTGCAHPEMRNRDALKSASAVTNEDNFYSIEKIIECEDLVPSVRAAEELVAAVKESLELDRRRRMNLDHDWQDPALLAEIKAATGVDLDMRSVKKRRRGEEGGLTDLKKAEDTPRKRLAKKVLSKRAVSALSKRLSR